MATPRVLARPPITEALVDLRASVSQPQEAFEAFAQELRAEFPKTEVRRGIKAELKVEQGKLIPPIAEDLGFQGVIMMNPDGTLIVQFRPDGFTFNNLKSYLGGDRLVNEALSLWSRFADRMQPSTVTRVALRYINRLELPFREGDEFTRFLTAPPQLPEGSPQTVSGFLERIVAHDHITNSDAIVTQRLDVTATGGRSQPEVLIDVDVFRVGESSIATEELLRVLKDLRILKNNIFFSLLTEAAIEYYT